ncbi:MAG: NUDIX domain-containing protein [Gammaproteobacteria bacterium]|nr:MAG: NUDIX domain-containing protein [Gammaproteobacteria bacterium]
MNYCSNCGNPVTIKIPAGDNRERHVCDNCDAVHYQNPRIIAGCIPVYGDRVLLCRRAIEPRRGYWTLPAGFLENGETVLQGALRECQEEAGAEISNPQLYGVYDIPHISQVYVFYRGPLLDKTYSAGEESLEVELFHEQEVPWDELAFPVITLALEHFFHDHNRESPMVRTATISRRMR